MKQFQIKINDKTYYLKWESLEGLMDYLVRVCCNNPNDITVKEI